jgi:copper chaperone CopZ
MATNPSTRVNTPCPGCGSKGKAVKPITIESLVDAEARGRLSTTEGFRFCKNPACDTAYFHTGTAETIGKESVTVRIGQKETDPPRPVCYCFGHTAEAIRDELAATGASTVFDEISGKCRQGLDRCAETNPQGSCCLGNVRAAVREAQADLGITEPTQAPPQPDCCSTSCNPSDKTASQTIPAPPDYPSDHPPARTGLWASGGAVLTAALASACCWLPLLLISLGVSAAGIGGFFQAYRPILLGVTVALLATGYYLVFKKPNCAPGSACATPNPKLRKLNAAMLGFATVAVLAFALFPNYLGYFLNNGNTASATTPPAATQPGQAGGADSPVTPLPTHTVQLDIDGMTCAACATGLTSYLNTRPGVRRADVDYDTRSASVELDDASGIDGVLKSISEYGFHGKVRQTP